MSDPQVLTPTGILNGESGGSLEHTIRDTLAGTEGPLLVDCSSLTFMDSSGFGHLVVALKLARQQERELLLCGLNSQLMMVLQLTGTDKIFRIYPTRQEAEAALVAS
ncbi:MAG: STAS domain-containing protein [Prochlorococcaceae cyanobacterium]|jgi:anti-anti-sigma factor